MNNPTAIIIAGGLIAASIVGAAWIGRPLENRYELAAPTSGDAPLGWRLDKKTGVVTPCELAKDPRALRADDPNDPFADLRLPPVMGSRSRPVDKVMVQCGYE